MSKVTVKNKIYKDALKDILSCGRLDIAKEIAADALDEDVEEYLRNEEQELDFSLLADDEYVYGS